MHQASALLADGAFADARRITLRLFERRHLVDGRCIGAATPIRVLAWLSHNLRQLGVNEATVVRDEAMGRAEEIGDQGPLSDMRRHCGMEPHARSYWLRRGRASTAERAMAGYRLVSTTLSGLGVAR